jgi:UDP-N-acetylmuramoyl-L-alanyl-D-glutamate--2,6-diaminopimelate ligase
MDRAVRNAKTAPLRDALSAVEALAIKRLVTDSRAVKPGDTFVAFPGEMRDGRDYIMRSLANGATSVLWEKHGFAWNRTWRVPNLGIADLRRRAGEVASHVYGRPSAQLWTVGVTGTNGKTSCSQWIAQSLTRVGRKCAVIGTLGSGFSGMLEASDNTTPDAVRLHDILRGFVRDGARAAAMEASSHGLVQHRLSGVEFDLALFTNLSRDHLDYHGTMRRYRAAKARLFSWPTLKWAILNLDDEFGAELVARVRRPGLNVIGYGFTRNGSPRTAGSSRLLRVQGRNLQLRPDGLSFDVSTPWGSASLSSGLIGRFNAANLLGSLATLLASDADLDASVNALQHVKALPGRTERYGGGVRPLVIVDFAHTPDALEQVLRALREIISHDSSKRDSAHRLRRAPRLICVFGCGGERDRGKRPLMGAVASRLADEVVITTDNPRHEDPLAIIADITRGARSQTTTIEPNRTRAIRMALDRARRGDVVLIAGKGHERYQEMGGIKRPYSDAAVATRVLRKVQSGARCP